MVYSTFQPLRLVFHKKVEKKKKVSFHSRSNSFPSQIHPLVECVEDHLRRLKASQATSTSASSVSANLAALSDLHEGINRLIQMPSVQQSLSHVQGECWINELLEGSLKLVDLCATSRDILDLTKESVHELESSLRRKKVAAVDFSAYAASRKRINKMVNKCLKSYNHKSAEKDCDLKTVGTMLKETESLGFSILNSVLILLSGEKDRSSRSFLSKLPQTSRVHSTEDEMCLLNIHKSRKGIDSMSVQKMLEQSEISIQELEEGLECLFRSLVKQEFHYSMFSTISLYGLLKNFVVTTSI